jgi:hypothetical protein
MRPTKKGRLCWENKGESAVTNFAGGRHQWCGVPSAANAAHHNMASVAVPFAIHFHNDRQSTCARRQKDRLPMSKNLTVKCYFLYIF